MRDVRRWWHQPSAPIVAPKARPTSYQPHRSVRIVRTERHFCTQCEDLELAYPVYQDIHRPARTLVNANLQYQLRAFNQAIKLSLEIDNLLDQRTYAVANNQQGVETGRSFWVGLEYTW